MPPRISPLGEIPAGAIIGIIIKARSNITNSFCVLELLFFLLNSRKCLQQRRLKQGSRGGVGRGGSARPPPPNFFYRMINDFLLFYHGQLIRT